MIGSSKYGFLGAMGMLEIRKVERRSKISFLTMIERLFSRTKLDLDITFIRRIYLEALATQIELESVTGIINKSDRH